MPDFSFDNATASIHLIGQLTHTWDGRALSREEIAELAVSTLEHHLETSRVDVLKMVELQGRE